MLVQTGRQAGRQAGRGRGYRQIALTQNNVEQIIDEIICKIDANRAEVKVHIRALLVESSNGGSLHTGQTARRQEEEECYSLRKGRKRGKEELKSKAHGHLNLLHYTACCKPSLNTATYCSPHVSHSTRTTDTHE